LLPLAPPAPDLVKTSLREQLAKMTLYVAPGQRGCSAFIWPRGISSPAQISQIPRPGLWRRLVVNSALPRAADRPASLRTFSFEHFFAHN